MFPIVIKRDGSQASFSVEKIAAALEKCFNSLSSQPASGFDAIVESVVTDVLSKYDSEVHVEQIQDIVEFQLHQFDEFDAAKAYILYRANRTSQRAVKQVPSDIKKAFHDSNQYFPTPIQKFQFFDKYSRFNYDLGRRETWVETVDRSVNYLYDLAGDRLDSSVYQRIRTSILKMEAMPSMRLLAMAGPAAHRNNIAIYNCSYQPVESVDSFVEAMLISMAGCGVGFSVENKYVNQLPPIVPQFPGKNKQIHVVEDTTEGWANALRTGFITWFSGYDVEFDYSLVRLAGAPLRTKGGRASGPEPLRQMLDFVRDRILRRAAGHASHEKVYLRAIDAHDIMCAIGNAAVAGGVRRTAMISLFDFDDSEMLTSKSGNFEANNSQRWNANNSTVWPVGGINDQQFITQFLEMVSNGRGEPGIFNRESANKMKPTRRQEAEFGTNPCGEINLRPWQFCNLTAAVARADDTYETLLDKVEVATIIGSIQSMATDFPGLRPIWKQNCEDERLLGVDITGQRDSKIAQDGHTKELLKERAVRLNYEYAKKLGINQSASITCVKPSGNSSQLLNCSSGLHTRWAPYYIRNVRVSASSPLFKVLRDANVPMDPENGQTADNATTWVIHFPMKSPDGAITRNDVTAIEQCNYWLQNKIFWTEHNPSVTITYKPHEVMNLMTWVWEHRDKIGGMSFLPSFDAQYAQMPYQEITKEEYEKLASNFPEIDFSKVWLYEESDLTNAAQELACVSGSCDL
jgi:ribonucleoside-diphosphate reductase alpha chain